MRKQKGYRQRTGREEEEAKENRNPSSGRTMMVLMGGMMAFCLATPFLLGSMAPYLARIGRFLPLESGYLGPVVFLLAHLAMIPLFMHKSKD